MAKKKIEFIWHDRKRILGMPLSFTKYGLSEDRFFVKKGFFNTSYEELVLYRVKDIALKRKFTQKLFGVGTVIIQSSDQTSPVIEVKNIKRSFDFKELLHSTVEEQKIAHRYRINEVIDDGEGDSDGDGIPDIYDVD